MSFWTSSWLGDQPRTASSSAHGSPGPHLDTWSIVHNPFKPSPETQKKARASKGKNTNIETPNVNTWHQVVHLQYKWFTTGYKTACISPSGSPATTSPGAPNICYLLNLPLTPVAARHVCATISDAAWPTFHEVVTACNHLLLMRLWGMSTCTKIMESNLPEIEVFRPHKSPSQLQFSDGFRLRLPSLLDILSCCFGFLLITDWLQVPCHALPLVALVHHSSDGCPNISTFNETSMYSE